MSLRRLIISLLFFSVLAVSPAGAHKGHIHPPSIGRSTHPYLQACIAPYLRIQSALAEGRLDKEIKQTAQELSKQAQAGAGQENEATGRTMLEGMAAGAQAIASAGNLEAARQGFGQVNKAMLPFFVIWTGHLSEHNLGLFYCADKEALQKRDKIDFSVGWMQKGETPKSPYAHLALIYKLPEERIKIMKRLWCYSLALTITFLWVGTASAHYNILLLDRSPIQYKLRGTVQLTYARGHLYKREWSKAPKPDWVKAFTFDGMSTDLTAKMKTDGQVTHIPWKIKRPGDTWLVAHLPLQWSEHDAAWVESSVRTIVHVGFSRGWQEPLGMTKVELLPLTRPYGILPGDVMRVQVLDSGKGLGGTMVYAEHYYEKPPQEPMPADTILTRAARTDSNGIAAITLPKPGWWVIMTVVEKGQREADGKKGLVKLDDALWVYVEK